MQSTITRLAALILAFIASPRLPSASADVITIGETNLQRVHDIDADGVGDSAFGSPSNNLVGFFADSPSVQNMQMVWAFQMTGSFNSLDIVDADFQADLTGLGSGAFDVDAHVIRTSSSSTILSSDYQTTAGLLMDNFNVSNTTGLKSLDAGGQSALTSFLQSNWSVGDYVLIGLKTDPLTLGGEGNDFYRYATDAELTLTAVPEPSSFALLCCGLGVVAYRLRRKAGAES